MKKLSRILLPVFVFAALALSACAGAATPASTAGGSKVEAALIEFTGVIESIDGNQWVVNGQTITVDPSVVDDGPFNVGDTIKVEAQVAADGSITVTRVESTSAVDNSNDVNENDDDSNDDNENDDNTNDDDGDDENSNGDDEDENEVVGMVTAMDETTITIDGQVFNLAEFTEIKDAIQVNDTVKLHFIVNADGTITVREVELSDPSEIENSNDDDDNSNDDNSNSDDGDDDDGDDDGDDDDDGGDNDDGGGDDGGDDDDSGSDDD